MLLLFVEGFFFDLTTFFLPAPALLLLDIEVEEEGVPALLILVLFSDRLSISVTSSELLLLLLIFPPPPLLLVRLLDNLPFLIFAVRGVGTEEAAATT
jgi:hypothetical protein